MTDDQEMRPTSDNVKNEQLNQNRRQNTGPNKKLTRATGTKVSNDERTLRAGRRGPTLFQDTHFYEKQSHFNRERIPERVVHARGYGAHGTFECYKSMTSLTRAHFLQKPGQKTSVFARFSTLVGSKGSKDTAQDVRGFAVKFYTEEGNYDLLGLSFPVFLVSDAMKFVDAVHALKPEPKTDIPQATSAHDNFWDFVSNNQETAHMIMWLMSGYSRPRSFRMMDGFPINTYRLINEDGKSTFVRFHFKAVLGAHGLLLDEAGEIGGVDPDFHRRDLIEAIERRAYPEYELGVQIVTEEDEFKYDFDVLDATKLWPEEDIPVEIIGKMTLTRLTDNEFAETEQARFDPANLIPGIDFSNDPILQGRSFAYRDTQYHRLGTGNIDEIPINKPIKEVNFNQRDSFVRHRIDLDNVNYRDNSLAGNTPKTTPAKEGGFAHYRDNVEGFITRDIPSQSFDDHFSQARMFWNSMTHVERQQITDSFIYHVGYVKSQSVRQQTVDMFAHVDHGLATTMADYLGVNPPNLLQVEVTKSSPALSLSSMPHYAATQKVGVLIGNGFNGDEVRQTLNFLEGSGVFVEVIGEKLGKVIGADGTQITVDKNFTMTYPVLYDSIYVVGGRAENDGRFKQTILEYIYQSYKCYKPIGIATTAHSYIERAKDNNLAGVVFTANNPNFNQAFLSVIAQQRFWNRT